MQQHLANFRDELLKRRRAIYLKVTSSDVQTDREALSANLSEQALQLENLDGLFQLDHLNRLELGRINYALDRIEHGRYGICIRCGDEIDRRRLDALPYADACMRCARAHE